MIRARLLMAASFTALTAAALAGVDRLPDPQPAPAVSPFTVGDAGSEPASTVRP